MASKRVAVLWNPQSGSSDQSLAARELLEARDDCTVQETSSGAHATRLAEEAATGGSELVIVAGGDGSVNAVVQGLMKTASPARLGILPTGTGNDLCRSLAIPLDPVEAAAWLTTCDEQFFRSIDVVTMRSPAEKLSYANMATGGNSGQFTEQLTDEMKQFWGPLCYLRGSLTVISDLVVFDLRVSFDGQPSEIYKALNVFVANGRTSGGGLQVAPRAELEDGRLDVVVVRDGAAVDLAMLATRFVVGDYLQSDLIVHRRVRTLSLEADPPILFSADGDVAMESPVEFSVSESALPVIVGRDYVVSVDAGESGESGASNS